MKSCAVRRRPESYSQTLRLLLVEDSEADAALLVERLEAAGYGCAWVRVGTREAFLEKIARAPGNWDLIVCDHSLPDFDGLSALQALRERDRITPFVLVSGRADAAVGIEALRAGATDYVDKGEPERFPRVVERALKEARAQVERRQSELALQSSEEKLRSIFDQALDVILIIQGVTGTILRANRAATAVLGHAGEDLVGKHFSVLFPPGDDQSPRHLLDRLRVSGPVFESQPFLRADGTLCPMDITASPLPWGNTQAILTTLRDATARNAAEETLRMTQFAVDHCRHLVLWMGPDGSLCYVNDSACALLGYRREELLGLNIAAVDPAFGPDLWPVHWEELRHHGSFTLDSTLRRKDGGGIPVETVVNYFAFQGKEYNCAIARDVTERRRAEEALRALNADLEQRVEQRTGELRRTEARLTALLRHSSDIISILGPDGIITYKSEAATSLLGFEASAFVGTPFLARTHPQDVPACHAALEEARRRPDAPVRFERRVAKKAGGWLAVESILSNQIANPAIGGFVVNSRALPDRSAGAAR